ncbi:nitrogenase cofactor biosynthesis protein NifB [Halorhodospira halophila]|uniref:FeMo cofactor biosynthesis protein NifB n=1 Tax=Halorhodospira halophila (strain DSM 244 / SL1) TaxID=349124 RepID=A1WTR3_HALHL|nr:nitrogenase cofactor biosynthesis protein NifB [Halorhodospira halophila SL1]MBK1729792.1 nitrogenase cofactor biosynthesis protein NifB [Halorhodospira halophila]
MDASGSTICDPEAGCPGVGGAGAPGDGLEHLPEALRAKVRDHPCYSERAHHHFARLHVAVAPGCNLSCNYCNRKYDCANESRPGVVSEVLTPEEAVAKTLAVAAEIPQLSVVGIAGPGDALANPRRTFETFERIREVAPQLRLCLSTNGLALPDYVDDLVALDVEHVTVTVNAIDPEIGAQIHPSILFEHRRRRGLEAARILLQRQLAGIEALAERGVLVKVNSVAIPGINHQHLPAVSRVVRQRGAFLHNVMPLISDPSHGTHFGQIGQRGPTDAELLGLRAACANDIAVMSHCQQCRADAAGMLGEDRGAEFSRARVAGLSLDPEAVRVRQEAAWQALDEQLREEEGTP